ncbi:glycosyltransferase [Plantactinospora siamensis]|uniref:Glycosyltransferase n=2 Tax=Plantactinospora siamensis TaxID=555372 RepID=A0ABV6P0M9_9ACTN
MIGPHGPDMFATNIGESLREMGHQVHMLGPAVPRPRSRIGMGAVGLAVTTLPAVESRLHHAPARAAIERQCDAVISVDHNIVPEAVAELRRNRIAVALWYPDHVANIGRQRMIASPYTAVFTKEPLLAERLRNTLGLRAFYLPQACNPRWHRPLAEPAEERTIVVVGNMYPSRLFLLRRLHEAGIPLTLYGGKLPGYLRRLMPPALRVHPPVFREAKSRVFRRAAAVLNNLHPAEMDGVNLRLFEATAAGAAVLCEDRRVVADLYEPDREVVPFTTFDELVDRASELLDNPALTREIGDAATKRAHAEHTYEQRLPQLLDELC